MTTEIQMVKCQKDAFCHLDSGLDLAFELYDWFGIWLFIFGL